jgi:hypothetical protein
VRNVPRYLVQLSFASDADRDELVPRLVELLSPGELTVDDAGARLAFDDVESPIAALVSAQILVHTACEGTDVAPIRVRRSPCA